MAMAVSGWAMGDAFSLADCAAAPALFYANEVLPFGESHKNAAAYLDRLKARPSYARVLKEAKPYFANSRDSCIPPAITSKIISQDMSVPQNPVRLVNERWFA